MPDEQNTIPATAPSEWTDWTPLVRRIQTGDSGALEALYEVFGRGVRLQLLRQLGPQDLDDRVHDAFLIVVQAIQRGDLREPERLMGFVRTIVRRQAAAQINHLVEGRRDQMSLDPSAGIPDSAATPEQIAVKGEKVRLMMRVLESLSSRDREILTRFYLKEQTQEQICREMNLSDTQFRLYKSRAKQRFGDTGRQFLERD